MRPEARARLRNDGRPPERAASCSPSGGGRQLPTMPAPGRASSGSERAMRVRSNWSCVAAILSTGVIVLLGCQNAGDDVATQARGGSPAEEVASDDYPLLQTVPPRPQLSYTVQQQREIVEALIADRENARYTSQVVRYRSGLSTLPPPPAPPVSEVTEAPEQAAPAGGAPSTKPDAAKPKESLLRAETFDVFLRALSRKFGSDAPKPAAPPEAPTTSVEPKQDTSQDAAAPDVVPTAGSVNDSADEIAPQAPSPPTGTAVAAPQAARSDQLVVSPRCRRPRPRSRRAKRPAWMKRPARRSRRRRRRSPPARQLIRPIPRPARGFQRHVPSEPHAPVRCPRACLSRRRASLRGRLMAGRRQARRRRPARLPRHSRSMPTHVWGAAPVDRRESGALSRRTVRTAGICARQSSIEPHPDEDRDARAPIPSGPPPAALRVRAR